MKNGIYLVATPIGNLGDITLRALEVLKEADVVACEDTRVTKKLLGLLGVSLRGKRFVPLHDHNESKDAQKVIAAALEGSVVAYVSDAGSPLVSDPGYKLAKEARESGVFLTTLPGACAAICGLQLSGLPSNNFMFCGFVPNKDKARIDFWRKYAESAATLICYERADRLTKTLAALQEVIGNREVAVVREITKMYEDCRNGTAQELLEYYDANPVKGEIVVLVAPKEMVNMAADYRSELAEELVRNNLKTAVANIVKKYNVKRNEVYAAALEMRDNG
ncbi:MAG: 16S rRNA (cytidine(1402)-2'-O)-methyltransferase [Alphaproteobacteria bacterium]|nr:16S rRNA (cytidine(1402)-2'-O)-methyltransferase [Alphaproteobacteria bacterium]